MPPNKIVQTANEVIFLYENQNQFRVVPTDCREHDPVLKYDQSFNGLAVGCWEGDTLVVTSMGFTDRTWLHWSGYIHSNEMTVIDNALSRPWTADKRYTRDADPLAEWFESVCTEYNAQVFIGKENYFLSADGYLMPARKDQPPPDTRYFKRAGTSGAAQK